MTNQIYKTFLTVTLYQYICYMIRAKPCFPNSVDHSFCTLKSDISGMDEDLSKSKVYCRKLKWKIISKYTEIPITNNDIIINE